MILVARSMIAALGRRFRVLTLVGTIYQSHTFMILVARSMCSGRSQILGFSFVRRPKAAALN